MPANLCLTAAVPLLRAAFAAKLAASLARALARTALHALLKPVAAGLLLLAGAAAAHGAGVLTPTAGAHRAPTITDHAVDVTINHGYARVEVTQRFGNPNEVPIEAVYRFPAPPSASLSEFNVQAGEVVLRGEVLRKPAAAQAYAEERAAGREAGLATREGFVAFEFRVAPIPARADIVVQFVYLQPLPVDAGVGRFLYPLGEGGTDAAAGANSFWTRTVQVDRSFRLTVEVVSEWPVDEVRAPGFENAKVERHDPGHLTWTYVAQGGTLAEDFVFYYRLADGLPGRVDLLAYKPSLEAEGTFMAVLTPGMDLQPLPRGADYVFVLDVSGSMDGKLPTLVEGVRRAIGELRPEDRFRLVTFNQDSRELTAGWTPATPAQVDRALRAVAQLRPDGGTNLSGGLTLGLQGVETGRATSFVLVTDGVANVGETAPARLRGLLAERDLRFFGFLLGNNANWPLMETLAEATGGTYTAVSNRDDIVGQLLLAKTRMASEALHNVQIHQRGVPTRDVVGFNRDKIFRGQQVFIFGRYQRGGELNIRLSGRITGRDREWQAAFSLPDQTNDYPELERLWALAMIHDHERAADAGDLPADQARAAIARLGEDFQLVTAETSMVVMRDEAFAARGLERRNLARANVERVAAARREAPAPAVAEAPVTPANAPAKQTNRGGFSPGDLIGGGAVGPVEVLGGAAGLAFLALRARRRQSAAADAPPPPADAA